MKRLVSFSLASTIMTLAVGAFCAQDTGSASTAFDAANKLYEEGKFSDAAAAYERLLQGGVSSPALYFNWGNAQFKAGRTGRAIAAYRKAEELVPRDPDVRANLRFAREQVQGPTMRAGWSERLLGALSLNEWSVSAVVALWMLFALLVVWQIRPAAKRPLRNWGFLAAAFLVVLGTGLALRLHARLGAQTAIVVVSDATVRNGPFEESPTAFTARDGAELRVLDQKDDWLQVTAGPRRLGWLPRKQVVVVPAL
jgi:tetratricopeptide (TPR) repeat protein